MISRVFHKVNEKALTLSITTTYSVELFYKLTRIAIGTSEPDLGVIPTPSDWKQLYGNAQKQAIVGILFDAIDKLPGDQQPPRSIGHEWLGQTSKIAIQNEIQNQRIPQVKRIFSNAGYRCCVLKGQVNAALYPIPSHRQSGDIDLLVDGNRKELIKFVKSKYKYGEIVYHHIEVHFFHDMEVEVHFHPTWFYNPISQHRLNKFVDLHQETLFTKGVTCEFNLVYSMIHIYRHIFHEGVGIRQLIDYFYILKASDKTQRSAAYATLRHLKMESITKAVMYVLSSKLCVQDDFLLCSANDNTAKRLGQQLCAEIESTGNFSHMGSKDENSFDKLLKFTIIYREEALWALPWKVWHFIVRKTY